MACMSRQAHPAPLGESAETKGFALLSSPTGRAVPTSLVTIRPYDMKPPQN